MDFFANVAIFFLFDLKIMIGHVSTVRMLKANLNFCATLFCMQFFYQIRKSFISFYVGFLTYKGKRITVSLIIVCIIFSKGKRFWQSIMQTSFEFVDYGHHIPEPGEERALSKWLQQVFHYPLAPDFLKYYFCHVPFYVYVCS